MAEVNDALGTTITWGTSTFVLLRMTIKVPAVESGDKIDITTLDNTAWRTALPKILKELGDAGFTARWDTAKHISAPIGSNELISITLPAGDIIKFQGYLKTLEPGDAVEGDKISCTGTLVATNHSGSAEVAPTYTPPV